MERPNNITSGNDLPRSSNNQLNCSSANFSECSNCFMKDKKADYVCTQCKVIICSDCSLRRHKSHVNDLYQINEYVENKESEYYNEYLGNLKVLEINIQELFDKECCPVDNAMEIFEKEKKNRKEILDLMQQRINSLIEEEESISEEIDNYILEEKRVLKTKQKKLLSDIGEKITYIEFHKEKTMRTKSIQQRATDIILDFLKEEVEKTRIKYLDELQSSKNKNINERISKTIESTYDRLKFSENSLNLEKQLKDFSNDYQIAVENFKKNQKGFYESNQYPTFYSFNRQDMILNQEINNKRKEVSLNEDIEMITDNTVTKQNSVDNRLQSNSKEENEFTIFEKESEIKEENRIIAYPRFNDIPIINTDNNMDPPSVSGSKSIINQSNSKTSTDKYLIKLDQGPQVDKSSSNQESKEKSDSNSTIDIPNLSSNVNGNILSNGKVNISQINASPLHNILKSKFYIGIKSKPNNEIYVFNSNTNTIKAIKIDNNSYEFDGASIPNIFPYENSKYVNIGNNSALVTGGNNSRSNSDNCFVITVSPFIDNPLEPEKVKISKVPNMNSRRERHNIIYLQDHNIVLTCSGFYIKTCEYNDLNSSDKRWRVLPELHETRGNATMFYMNNKYVYILSGFKVNEGTGEYLNSMEYMDFTLKDKWTFVDLNKININNINLKISAMGCIKKDSDRILLVGGYDGNSYLKGGFDIIFKENGEIENIEKKDNLLSKGSIFFSNPMFMKIDENNYFNFELQSKGILYDKIRQEFQQLGLGVNSNAPAPGN